MSTHNLCLIGTLKIIFSEIVSGRLHLVHVALVFGLNVSYLLF